MTQLANVMRIKCKDPVVGDGVTVFHYTDRSAGTVTRVSDSGNTAWFRFDHSVRIDKNGQSEDQTYEYLAQNGHEIKVTRRKNGEWKISGSHQMYMGGHKVAFGIRDAYHDYSF